MKASKRAGEQLFPIFERLCVKLHDQGVESLSEKDIAIIAVYNFFPTVENGAFYTWFWNSTGDWATQTVIALESIGATRSAASLKQAIDFFPSSAVVADREARIAFLEGCSPEQTARLEGLCDDLFANDEDIYQLLLDFWRQKS